MKDQFKKLGGAIRTAFTVGAVATFAYFKRFATEMDRIGKLSKRLKETPETIQRIGLAAQLSGSNLEGIVKGMQTLAKNVAKTVDGSVAYEDSLKESWLVPVLDVAHDNGFAWFFQPDLDRRLREVRGP